MVQSADLLNVYQLGRKCIYEAIEGLSQEEAAWKPAENVKSIQALFVHIGGAEKFWLSAIGYGVLDFPESSDMEDAKTFVKGMEGLMAQYLNAASQEKLNEKISTDRGDLSLAWVVKRVTQHMFYHLGTFVYLRLILQPAWEGQAGLSTWQKAVDSFSSLVETES